MEECLLAENEKQFSIETTFLGTHLVQKGEYEKKSICTEGINMTSSIEFSFTLHYNIDVQYDTATLVGEIWPW